MQITGRYIKSLDFLVGSMIKNLPGMQETRVQSLGQEDSLEKKMTSHSSRESHGQRSLVGHSPWGRKGTLLSNYTTITYTFIKNCIRKSTFFFFFWLHCMAYRIFLPPQPGIKAVPSALEMQSVNH